MAMPQSDGAIAELQASVNVLMLKVESMLLQQQKHQGPPATQRQQRAAETEATTAPVSTRVARVLSLLTPRSTIRLSSRSPSRKSRCPPVQPAHLAPTYSFIGQSRQHQQMALVRDSIRRLETTSREQLLLENENEGTVARASEFRHRSYPIAHLMAAC